MRTATLLSLRVDPALREAVDVVEGLAEQLESGQRSPRALDRDIKGFRDEALRGEWKGFRSSRLNEQWRVLYAVQSDRLLVRVIRVTPHDYRKR